MRMKKRWSEKFREMLLGWINTQLATPQENFWIVLRETRNIEKAVGEVSMGNSKLATPSFQPVARLTTPRGKSRRIFRWGCVKSRLSMRAHTTFQRRVEGGKATVVGCVGYNVKFTVVFPRLSTEQRRLLAEWKASSRLEVITTSTQDLLQFICLPAVLPRIHESATEISTPNYSVGVGMLVQVVASVIGRRVALDWLWMSLNLLIQRRIGLWI